MPIRMKDIAADVGVSIITVSKVLRNHPDISAETRARVLRRIEELNYQPNLAARALATGRTYSIGLVVPDLIHPFFAELAKALSEILSPAGYGLLMSSSQEDPTLESKHIEQMLARGVDALFIASTAPSSADLLKRLESAKALCILIDRNFPAWHGSFIGSDNLLAGALATRHLLSLGRRRIAHIHGNFEWSTAAGRRDGYLQALREAGLKPQTQLMAPSDNPDAQGDLGGYRAMQTLLALPPHPDAVFCYNDPTATGAIQAILDAGLRIPEDIAVIGCGNILYSQYLRIPLSTIDQQTPAMGHAIAHLALDTLAHKRRHPKPTQLLLEPKLIARASTLGAI